MTLVLAYPYDLLPEKVQQAADAVSAKPQKPLPAQVEPSSASQGASFADSLGKTPARPKQPSNLPLVILNTTSGPITIELFENDSPNTVANFISLVESGFYDGLTFHRKVSTADSRGFIQGGSPDGTGIGGPGYKIVDEVSKKNSAVRGSLIMARNHKVANTAGSQFLIAL
ncbi:MAG: peptidylprolyl isomerase, partial [Planctomycetaceae bacterium]|nr:peptidylprolyl isomerase [Planctomycetaceae bacterium]